MKRTRVVSPAAVEVVVKDIDHAAFVVSTVLARHHDLMQSRWLGGEAFEVPPPEVREALALVRQAQNLLHAASHDLVMCRIQLEPNDV